MNWLKLLTWTELVNTVLLWKFQASRSFIFNGLLYPPIPSMLGHFCHSCALFPVPGVNGLRMLGIIHDTVVFLIEQLYGAKHCHNYKFRFHKPEEANEPPPNPHGSARAEVHLRQVWALQLLRLTRTQAKNLESAESSQFLSKCKQLSPVNQLYCIFFVCMFCCVFLCLMNLSWLGLVPLFTVLRSCCVLSWCIESCERGQTGEGVKQQTCQAVLPTKCLH